MPTLAVTTPGPPTAAAASVAAPAAAETSRSAAGSISPLCSGITASAASTSSIATSSSDGTAARPGALNSRTRPITTNSSRLSGRTASSALRQPSPSASAPPTSSGAPMPTPAATALASVMAAGPVWAPCALDSAAGMAMQR